MDVPPVLRDAPPVALPGIGWLLRGCCRVGAGCCTAGGCCLEGAGCCVEAPAGVIGDVCDDALGTIAAVTESTITTGIILIEHFIPASLSQGPLFRPAMRPVRPWPTFIIRLLFVVQMLRGARGMG